MGGSVFGLFKECVRVGVNCGNVVFRSFGVGVRVCRVSRLRIGYLRRRRVR